MRLMEDVSRTRDVVGSCDIAVVVVLDGDGDGDGDEV